MTPYPAPTDPLADPAATAALYPGLRHAPATARNCEPIRIVPREVVQIVLRLGVEPVYRAAIFAGSMVLSSQMAATVPSVM